MPPGVEPRALFGDKIEAICCLFFNRRLNTCNANKIQTATGIFFIEQVMDVPERGWAHIHVHIMRRGMSGRI